MPIISSFFGIYIRMYFADHAPPHFHVEYQGHMALVAIADGTLLERRAAVSRARARATMVHGSPRRAGAELEQRPSPVAAEPDRWSGQ